MPVHTSLQQRAVWLADNLAMAMNLLSQIGDLTKDSAVFNDQGFLDLDHCCISTGPLDYSVSEFMRRVRQVYPEF